LAILSSEVNLYLSGGAGNTNVNASLGGGRSSTVIAANTSNNAVNLQNLFPNTTTSESLAGKTRNRCIYLRNDSTTDTAHFVYVWLSQNTPSNDTVNIFVKPGVTVNTVEPAIASETDDPYAGMVWQNWMSYSQALNNQLPDLPPGGFVGIWLQNFIPAQTPTYSNNFVGLAVSLQNY